MSTLIWAGNLIANVIVSVLSSWLVAHFYFRKVTRGEKIADQTIRGLQRLLVPVTHPQFFDRERSLTVHPIETQPENEDVPFVEYAVLGQRSPRPGQSPEVLIKLRDSGLDLVNPDGVSVRDHEGNPVEVVSVGLGFAKFKIYISTNVPPGHRELKIELQDRGEHTRRVPNRNVQTLPFVIEQGGPL